MSNESNELIREVTTSLRNDQIKEFYQKNAKTIWITISSILVVIIAIAGTSLYKKKQNEKYSTDIQKSIMAQQSGKIEESKEDLEKVFFDQSAPEDLKAIAGFRLAAVYLGEGKEENIAKVISIYEQINNCQNCDSYSKDVAGMLWVKFNISNNAGTQYDELIGRIIKVENLSKHFKYEIAIDRGFYEIENNHLKKARKIFEFVSDSLEANISVKEMAKKGIRIIEQKSAK